MDDGIINLIKNEVPNDYCKLLCVQVIENENQNIDNYYIFQLMSYCIFYDFSYFIEYLYKNKQEKDFFDYYKLIDFLYLYYLKENKKENIELTNKIIENYKKRKKKLIKEIKTLKIINFGRIIIKHDYRKKKKNIVVRKSLELDQRLLIIAECIQYKFLIDNLGLEDNKKIDRMLNWNIYLLKKINTIEDKIWLI